MQHTVNWVEKRQSLRTQAEQMLARVSPAAGSPEPLEQVFREMMVYKVELEMQIEELRESHLHLQMQGERYRTLQEQAPAACLTVDAKGLVSAANQSAVQLLGHASELLLRKPLAKFMATTRASDRWHLLLQNGLLQIDAPPRPCVLDMRHASGATFQAYVCSRRFSTPGLPPVLNLVLTDMQSVRLAQAEAEVSA